MGCLNSDGRYSHWFGNIHLSGPCNRACYFCIGQHMMNLDPLNTLDTWPLPGLDDFIRRCQDKGVREVNLTGSNTDPLLFTWHDQLERVLRERIYGVRLGIRTNGVVASSKPADLTLSHYDKASISVTSLDPAIYRKTMGGELPQIEQIVKRWGGELDLKANVVLCPEILGEDLKRTLEGLADMGFHRINVREPYGQPRIGDVLANWWPPIGTLFGMPIYQVRGAFATYWDVHYVGVESVNLYATGHVSLTYPVTVGCVPGNGGTVLPQSEFKKSGRVREQWVKAGGAVAGGASCPTEPGQTTKESQ